MACRIRKDRFLAMAQEEADKHGLQRLGVDHHDPVEAFDMVEVIQDEARADGPIAILNRKAIQSLVDEPEQARPIIRNLLRWAKEHGAK
mgnify:CR=1 FL=1